MKRTYVDTAHHGPLASCSICSHRASFVVNFSNGSTSARCFNHTSKEYDR